MHENASIMLFERMSRKEEDSAEGSEGMGDRERAARMARLGLVEGDCYFTEEGYLVYTEQFHRKRGYCCQSGCRHCPYGFNDKKRQRRTG